MIFFQCKAGDGRTQMTVTDSFGRNQGTIVLIEGIGKGAGQSGHP